MTTTREERIQQHRALGFNRGDAALHYNVSGLMSFYDEMFRENNIEFPIHLVAVAHALMDERISKLMIILGPGSGKSSLLSIAYPAFCLGHDPTMTILNISAGEGLVQGFMKTVMDWVEWSPVWKHYFPNIRPDKNAGWSSERGMFITGRNYGDPDASYFVAGLSSSVLTGKHGRLILMDDIHNRENSTTVTQCDSVRKTYYDTIIGRANPKGARFIAAGRRWSTDDIYGHWKESGDWVVMELPSFRRKTTELYWDITIPKNLECCFNDGSLEVRKSNYA
ncbi:MAG: hypothetical protein KGJ90_00320 [Patescibacteria group bacterium]|nr:hypothetical protein [Patescibacteria group bacterium]